MMVKNGLKKAKFETKGINPASSNGGNNSNCSKFRTVTQMYLSIHFLCKQLDSLVFANFKLFQFTFD